MTDVKCGTCGARYRAPESAAGNTLKCKKCGGVVRVPTGSPEGDVDLSMLDLAMQKGQPKPKQAPAAPQLDSQETAFAKMLQRIDSGEEEQVETLRTVPKLSRKQRRQAQRAAAESIAAAVTPTIAGAETVTKQEDGRYGRSDIVGLITLGATLAWVIVCLVFIFWLHGMYSESLKRLVEVHGKENLKNIPGFPWSRLLTLTVLLPAIFALTIVPAATLATFINNKIFKLHHHASLYSLALGWCSIPVATGGVGLIIGMLLGNSEGGSHTSAVVAGGIGLLVGGLISIPAYWYIHGYKFKEGLCGYFLVLVFEPIGSTAAGLCVGLLLAITAVSDFGADAEKKSAFSSIAKFVKPRSTQHTPSVATSRSTSSSAPEPARVDIPDPPRSVGPFAVSAPPPALHPLSAGQPLEDGVTFYEVQLSGDAPGQTMRLWVYLPAGDHANHTLPAVFIPAKATSAVTGGRLVDEDRSRHAGYYKQGLAVVAYDTSGPWAGKEYNAAFAAATVQFQATDGGVANLRNALKYAKAQVGPIDPKRTYALGVGYGGNIGLLLSTIDNPDLTGAIAFSPRVDLRESLWSSRLSELEAAQAGTVSWIDHHSPHAFARQIQRPILVFSDYNTEDEIKSFIAVAQQAGIQATAKHMGSGSDLKRNRQHAILSAAQWARTGGSSYRLNPVDAALANLQSDDSRAVFAALKLLADSDLDPAKQAIVSDALNQLLAGGLHGSTYGTALRAAIRWRIDKLESHLIKAVEHYDDDVSSIAVEHLAENRSLAPVSHLLEEARRDDKALATLRQYGADIEEQIVERIRTESFRGYKARYVSLLADCGSGKSMPLIRQLSHDGHSEVALAAREVWQTIDPKSFQPVQLVIKDLTSDNRMRQATAVGTLKGIEVQERYRRQVNQAMADYISSTYLDDEEYESIAQAMEPWQDNILHRQMMEWLKDRHARSYRRQAAMELLSRWQRTESIPLIRAWLLKDSDTATAALVRFGEDAQKAMIAVINHKNENIAVSAIKVLGEVGTDKSLRRLHEIKDGRRVDASFAAANAIDLIENRMRQEQEEAP